MKYSGIEWIGNIPDNWNSFSIRNVLNERIEKNTFLQEKTILSLSAKNGVTLYTEDNHSGNKPREDLSDYKIVRTGDIVLNSMNILSGSVGLSKYNGVVSPVYYMYYIKNNADDIRFFAYIFQTKEFQKSLRGLGNGILIRETESGNLNTIRTRIPSKKLGMQYIPWCDPCTQKRVSDYLDKKGTELSLLISNEQKQIELLEKYKMALITKAVTQGLDYSCSFKETGIKWIGKIPSDWKTIKIKFTSWLKGRIGWDGLKSSEFVDNGPYLITGTDFENGGINWDTCVHISEERYQEDELLHIKEDDLLITKDGTIGKLAIVKNCPEKVSLNSGVMIIRNTTQWKYFDKYLYYVLSSNQFFEWYELSQSGNSTIRHLYQGQFYDFEYTYPDLETQKRIAEYLDKKSNDIDVLIQIKEKKIDLLNAYKKSLIYECVTGKKNIAYEE